MGMGAHLVEAIIREHLFRQITGDVLLMGRQTVYYTPHDLLAQFQSHGIDTKGVDPASIALDTHTIDRKAGYAHQRLVADVGLFELLGAKRTQALDHSHYEGADIIHDLRYPLPSHLHEIADVVVDGSTLDNVFTPSVTLRNYSELLRPRGRLIALNAFSEHDTPYAIMPPLWYVDYFTINGFADCKAYIILYCDSQANAFYVDLAEIKARQRGMGRFHSPHHMVVLVVAEKGDTSTSHVLPNQQDYRSSAEWETYLQNLDVMLQSKRHHLCRSGQRQFQTDIPGGHTFIDHNFQAKL